MTDRNVRVNTKTFEDYGVQLTVTSPSGRTIATLTMTEQGEMHVRAVRDDMTLHKLQLAVPETKQ